MANHFEEGLWFVGKVIDVASDPDKLGYIKVRIPVDDDGFLDEDIPWCYPLLPVTSASYNQIGISPTGIEINSQVFGLYLDGRAHNERLILGTIPAIRNGDVNNHDVSKLARGENSINKSQTGPEPASSYGAIYPFNKVFQSRSGHVIEVDDTPTAERIHVYHKSGTYIEIGSDGKTVIKSVGDSFHISAKNNEVYVQGDMKLTVKGNLTAQVDGNMDISAKGSLKIKSDTKIEMTAPTIITSES